MRRWTVQSGVVLCRAKTKLRVSFECFSFSNLRRYYGSGWWRQSGSWMTSKSTPASACKIPSAYPKGGTQGPKDWWWGLRGWRSRLPILKLRRPLEGPLCNSRFWFWVTFFLLLLLLRINIWIVSLRNETTFPVRIDVSSCHQLVPGPKRRACWL